MHATAYSAKPALFDAACFAQACFAPLFVDACYTCSHMHAMHAHMLIPLPPTTRPLTFVLDTLRICHDEGKAFGGWSLAKGFERARRLDTT
jgi:hypothetical protein